METVATAYSSHKFCFICKEKNLSLHRVKKPDIIYAYVNHKIYIKRHARCCNRHYDDNKLIRKEIFAMIPTIERRISSDILSMFNMLSRDYNSPFQHFKEIKYLDNQHCLNITGWQKADFIEFCSLIKSLCNTHKRSKEQLIALYRYWLHTGMHQKDLALMFGPDTKQREISHYLHQARTAINKDFVHHYLGANKEREFFLKFNTKMTQKLHNLTEDTLVVVADGTYCKIQKSKSNNFQYLTFSQQKLASLFKPFIICCADGYIIDCYGPFGANYNDAEILDYILDSDEELKNILLPDKTMFLVDRGTLMKNKIFFHLIFFKVLEISKQRCLK